jgi:glycosyltransferase involved in cell wall biosynthesis
LGHVEDPAEVLAGADLLMHAATVEGVPQVIIQALAAGRPVVATDVTGLREVGDASVVVLPSSGAGLAASVLETIRHPPPQVELESLRPWTCAEIDASISDLYAGLGM